MRFRIDIHDAAAVAARRYKTASNSSKSGCPK